MQAVCEAIYTKVSHSPLANHYLSNNAKYAQLCTHSLLVLSRGGAFECDIILGIASRQGS